MDIHEDITAQSKFKEWLCLHAHDIQPCKCPNCGALNYKAEHTKIDDYQSPQAADISICFKCYEILQFDENLQLKKADVDLLDTDLIIEIHKAINFLKRTKGGRNVMHTKIT